MSHEASITSLDEDLHAYYLGTEQDETLFEKWERGEARGDSTTPSVCSPEYRAWMLDRLREALAATPSSSLLSVGAGNAMVERTLCREGYHVLAVDVAPGGGRHRPRATGARRSAATSAPGIPARPLGRRLRRRPARPPLRRVRRLPDGAAPHARLARPTTASWSSPTTCHRARPGQAGAGRATASTGSRRDWIADEIVGGRVHADETTEFVYERPLSGNAPPRDRRRDAHVADGED